MAWYQSFVSSYTTFLGDWNITISESSSWKKSHKPLFLLHDDVIKCKHFPRYWPFVRIIHRSPVNSPHKGQWRGALMFSLICVWINGWVNNREAGDLRRYRAHYDVIVMVMAHWRIYMYAATSINKCMTAISQTIYSDIFLWMKSLVFW